MDNAALNIDGIVKIYPHRHHPVTALNRVSFDILDNEFFTLLGPSGCGKTTLLRIIAGFEDITEGQVRLYGDDISTLAPHERPVNTVFQQYALFPHLSVADNVAFGLKRLGKPADEVKSRTAAMLDLIRMTEFGQRKPHELSGGQQQRVALARALAPAPKVLLLDEPLSALDLKLRQAMRDELKAIQKQTGITFVFVTHDQEEALAMSDRIAVMSNGEVQQIGAPREIYNNPTNHFVANFIGEANILSVEASPGRGRAASLTFGGVPVGKVDMGRTIKKAETISVMVRPEHLSITPLGSRKPAKALSGTVREMSYLGTDTQLHIALGDSTELVARLQNDAGQSGDITSGDSVAITFDEKAIRVLED
ncbi:MAG: ABC transporter ATP-binding protein [Candidatus Puniceispirillales bacterium]